MFQQWSLVQSSVVCEIVDDGDDDMMDGGGGNNSTYDGPFVDYPEDEVEVPNVYKTTKGTFSWSVVVFMCVCVCLLRIVQIE